MGFIVAKDLLLKLPRENKASAFAKGTFFLSATTKASGAYYVYNSCNFLYLLNPCKLGESPYLEGDRPTLSGLN